uniref:Major facilitator superfamily (MFS) profile domain-containing protein n=1 Tax=Araucaria cunninghamii TaxID=56994 RepID=A0A0D6R7Q4_ARACU
MVTSEGHPRAPLLEELKETPAGTLSEWRLFPSSMKFIFWNEFCERFSFYGLKAILALFLADRLGLSELKATEMLHVFTMACYATPVLGAVISDTLLGKYRTILSLSLLYALGNWVMSVSAIPDLDPVTKRASTHAIMGSAAGLMLIAMGTGGIKPCVAAFGGDQIEFSMPHGHVKERLRMVFFSVFYFAINVGAFLSMIITPLLRANVSYAAAFGMPSVLMVVSVLIFWAGRGKYVHRGAVGSVFSTVGKVVVDAVRLRKGDFGYQRGDSHWLDPAKVANTEHDVEDVKALLRVIVFLLPAPMFGCLYGQKASVWVFQARQMNGRVSWLGDIIIRPDQMQALDPFLILFFIPLSSQVIYPFFEKHGMGLKLMKRMILGMFLCCLAIFTSGLVQLAIDRQATSGSIGSYSNAFPTSEPAISIYNGVFNTINANGTTHQVSILWQVPQYAIITAAEVLFSITGLEFAYSQAPVSMKSVVQAVWLLTSAAGDMVTISLVGIIGDKLTKANRSFLFVGVGLIAMLFMIWISSYLKYKEDVNDEVVSMADNLQIESTVI